MYQKREKEEPKKVVHIRIIGPLFYINRIESILKKHYPQILNTGVRAEFIADQKTGNFRMYLTIFPTKEVTTVE